MLILWQIQRALQSPFNMYNTNNDRDGYCLLYYVTDEVSKINSYKPPETRAHQIIPYCLRSSEKNVIMGPLNNSTIIDSTFTFAQLREQNISSDLLMSWSAPIEQAERYQIFLNNVSNLSSEANTVFYNCTHPWFGPFCRFRFDIIETRSLSMIVYWNFALSKIWKWAKIMVTCYKHLQCNTSLICLDWREICDGKLDCHDGSDEFNCWQLEINECDKDEYRCYNGQCIPGSFFHDYEFDPDCLDRTDEFKPDNYRGFCSHDPAFRCEEHKCHPGTYDFSCSGGLCEQEMEICFKSRSSSFIHNLCENAMLCILYIPDVTDEEWCKKYCAENARIEDHCPPFYEFPPRPILFGHVKFIYSREEVVLRGRISPPKYVCYSEELCADFLPATVHWNGSACRYYHELGLKNTYGPVEFSERIQAIKELFHKCLMVSNEIHYLNQTTMYQCQNSRKYISKYRLLDRTMDCPFGDDETHDNESCSLNDVNYRFHCSIGNTKLCFAPFIPSFNPMLTIKDVYEFVCENLGTYNTTIGRRNNEIYFQTICDGIQDLFPVLIEGRNQTDETGCEHWPCNNTYTRCNNLWSCQDGADEVNCAPSTCPEFYHECVFLNDTLHVSCLHMDHFGDGIVDCLGATDELNHCLWVRSFRFWYEFSCRNNTACLGSESLCNGKPECPLGDDELFCDNTNGTKTQGCYHNKLTTKVEHFLCKLPSSGERGGFVHFFTLQNIPTYSSPLILSSEPSPLPNEKGILASQNNLMINNINSNELRCNKGLRIYIRTSTFRYNLSCLCPPSYYGDQCQYQNQRVSLTVQIRATSDWTTMFTFLIFLIDDETNIESHDYIEYSPVRDCNMKFNVYLLYSTRPKNSSKNYSIRIDAFNRMKVDYRASWIFPIRFPFLPVHRLPVRLIIPMVNVEPLSQCSFPCIHGQCFTFVNEQNSSFCRCFSGWSGVQCNKSYSCNCEDNSQCIDESICLCPIDRFGPRCYLFQSACHSEPCLNSGQCILDDERYTYAHKNKRTCFCPPEYTGAHCEDRRENETQIDISFDNSLIVPPWLAIHLVQVHNKTHPNQTSMMKKIGFDQTSLRFYTRIIFHIAFAQMSKSYYLIILQQNDIVSSHISIKIVPSQRCRSINELFNETVLRQELLQRIKLYHIPCQQRRELVCFYDSIHFCLCDHDRRANCFRFDHDDTHDCGGYSLCEHGSQCSLDDKTCPTLTTCACYPCYFGSQCQFSTQESILLLDIILGYRISSNTKITEQPNIVKGAIALTTIIFVLGLISNFLTFLTFQMKNTHDVGCGIYLFTSSIISIIIMCVLTLKFWLLLMSQIGSIKSRLFIEVQCVSMDFLLRILLVSGDWFRACVSIERAVNVSRGANFDKLKSKKVAKWILLLIFLFTICTHIHDPIHRRLVDDEKEQHTWCMTKYSSSIRIFDMIMNIIHFFIPFIINFISALFIIIIAARSRSNAQKKVSYKQHLREQFQQHKHLLISSLILFVLAIPRLYIAFLSGCMKSTRESWFYLIGYYISFIPSILTFIIFVLPSKMYRKEFKKSIKRFL